MMFDKVANKDLTLEKAGRFLARQWSRHPAYMPIVLTLSLLAALCEMSVPWAAGALVDRANSVQGGVWWAWAILVAAYGAAGLLRVAVTEVKGAYQSRNTAALADDAFSHVLSLSSRWHAENHVGGTVVKITRGLSAYTQLENLILGPCGTALLVLVGLTTTLTLRWPVIGATCGTMLVVTAGFLVLGMGKLLAAPAARHAQINSEIASTLSDSVACNAAVKDFGQEDAEARRFAQVTDRFRDIIRRIARINGLIAMGQAAFLTVLLGLLTSALLERQQAGLATGGDVAFGVTAFIMMSAQIVSLAQGFRASQEGIAYAGIASDLLETPPEVSLHAEGAELQPRYGRAAAIAFEDVVFAYDRAGPRLFDGLSLAIRPGERVALVGPTGSGKSTFVKLLQRLYEIDSGRITLDGVDVGAVNARSLRRQIAVVPQDAVLFHRTIRENIRFGRDDASDEEVIQAARHARAHDFIVQLPDGYETVVGERGVKLSGGERQRIAIARAFLSEAPILILDEASSALDVETEALVQEAIERLVDGRTTIAIAHRLSTIKHADRILVFEKGRVVQQGRHEDLARDKGLYARLAQLAFS